MSDIFVYLEWDKLIALEMFKMWFNLMNRLRLK